MVRQRQQQMWQRPRRARQSRHSINSIVTRQHSWTATAMRALHTVTTTTVQQRAPTMPMRVPARGSEPAVMRCQRQTSGRLTTMRGTWASASGSRAARRQAQRQQRHLQIRQRGSPRRQTLPHQRWS